MDCELFTLITMKGGLCFIYTSLLTVSVISSCALFLIVVSEVPQSDANPNGQVDLSGLHNVSQKVNKQDVNNYAKEPFPENKEDAKIEKANDNLEKEKMTFTETLSLNSVTTDRLTDTGQPPILITLGDTAKLDLKNPDELLLTNDSESQVENDTKSFVLLDNEEAKGKPTYGENDTTETLVVQAKSMHDRKTEDELPIIPSTAIPTMESQETDIIENIPVKPETPQEDIPSFSEWAQKQLAEAEKKDVVLNHSSQPSHSSTNISSKSTKSAKVRSKNYASPACGAKIVAVNPEAGSPTSILSPNSDEYMLNTCNSRIWFVVELCEAVQAQKIEIANFELFSSTPKDFVVYSSDRFPTRDWASVGQFTAKDMRDVQSFDLFPHLFGKFIKVELLSHHGSEHYCPISLFKVYGTSEFEVLEKESSQHASHIDEDDDDDDIIDVPDLPSAEKEQTKNLFGSARDAVMSIVKKAAQVLGKGDAKKNMTCEHNDTSVDQMYKRCCSPSHIIVCDNCSDAMYHEVFELISCEADKLTALVRQAFLKDTLKCTGICQPFGLDFKSTKTIEFSDERMAYVKALFPPKYLAALCNILAVKEKKVVLNTSYETESNFTSNTTVDVPKQIVNCVITTEKEIKLEVVKNDTESPVEKESEIVVPVESPEEQESLTNTIQTESTEQDIDKSEDDNSQQEVTGNTEEQDTRMQETEETVKATDSELKDTQTKAEPSTEKPKETNSQVDEVTEQITIENDNLISEFDQMAVDPTPGSQVNQNQQASIQKESVFLRLSNRVKTLERNMSLSGQYLEELSRRYKKQVEEMQKTFEKTVLQMTEERKKSNEREQKFLEQMSNLQDQMEKMGKKLAVLMEERDSWFGNVTFFKLVVFHSFITGAIFYFYFYKRPTPEPVTLQLSKRAKKKQDKFRRKSVEGVSGHETPTAKQRRPSEEALHIAREIAEDHKEEDFDGDWQIARKNRKRKTSIVHRNMEFDKAMFFRQDTIGELQENPIPLDEEEFIAPVSEPTEFIKEVKKNEVPKTNGSLFSSFKKTRRLSSPAFLRTLSRQSSRSTPIPVVRTLESSLNGKAKKKAASESPTGSLWSESTDISQNISNDSDTCRKRKSLKNLFRKVF